MNTTYAMGHRAKGFVNEIGSAQAVLYFVKKGWMLITNVTMQQEQRFVILNGSVKIVQGIVEQMKTISVT